MSVPVGNQEDRAIQNGSWSSTSTIGWAGCRSCTCAGPVLGRWSPGCALPVGYSAVFMADVLTAVIDARGKTVFQRANER